MAPPRPRKSQNEAETLYKASGVWKCPKSPSGAHYLEFKHKTSENPDQFECRHCGYVKEIPATEPWR